MKIAVINPNTTRSMTEAICEAAKRSAGAGTELMVRQSPHGPAAIEGPFDAAMCLPGLLEAIRDAEADGALAHVIACFDDTGLDAARALSRVPVVGIGEAALHVASLLAQQFCIVTTLSRSVPTLQANVARYGFDRRCRSVLASDIPVLDLHRPESGARGKISELMRRGIADGAEAAVLGCAGMADLAEDLRGELGIPVIDGVDSAVRLAELLARAGQAPSKIGGWAYPFRAGQIPARGDSRQA